MDGVFTQIIGDKNCLARLNRFVSNPENLPAAAEEDKFRTFITKNTVEMLEVLGACKDLYAKLAKRDADPEVRETHKGMKVSSADTCRNCGAE